MWLEYIRDVSFWPSINTKIRITRRVVLGPRHASLFCCKNAKRKRQNFLNSCAIFKSNSSKCRSHQRKFASVICAYHILSQLSLQLHQLRRVTRRQIEKMTARHVWVRLWLWTLKWICVELIPICTINPFFFLPLHFLTCVMCVHHSKPLAP
jgi:hypothetical protein